MTLMLLFPVMLLSVVYMSGSGLVGHLIGMEKETDVRAPDDPVMCGRLKNSETFSKLKRSFCAFT